MKKLLFLFIFTLYLIGCRDVNHDIDNNKDLLVSAEPDSTRSITKMELTNSDHDGDKSVKKLSEWEQRNLDQWGVVPQLPYGFGFNRGSFDTTSISFKIDDSKLTFVYDQDTIYAPRALPALKYSKNFKEIKYEYIAEIKSDSAWFTLGNGNDYMIEYLPQVVFYDGGPYKRLKIIHDINHKTKSHPLINILWLGDIDKDGKLDIVEDRVHEIGSGVKIYLHLSSRAKENQLTSTVAGIIEEGC